LTISSYRREGEQNSVFCLFFTGFSSISPNVFAQKWCVMCQMKGIDETNQNILVLGRSDWTISSYWRECKQNSVFCLFWTSFSSISLDVLTRKIVCDMLNGRYWLDETKYLIFKKIEFVHRTVTIDDKVSKTTYFPTFPVFPHLPELFLMQNVYVIRRKTGSF